MHGINWDQAQRYQREVQEERDNLRFLLDVNNLLVSHHDYPGLVKAIAAAVERVVPHDHISIALYDAESGLLRFHWAYDDQRGLVESDATIALERSAAGIAFERGTACVFSRSELETLGLDSAPNIR